MISKPSSTSAVQAFVDTINLVNEISEIGSQLMRFATEESPPSLESDRNAFSRIMMNMITTQASIAREHDKIRSALLRQRKALREGLRKVEGFSRAENEETEKRSPISERDQESGVREQAS